MRRPASLSARPLPLVPAPSHRPVFQYTYGVWLYWSGLFIVWLVKFTLLHYGGIRAYLAGKPFFYGLAIGYVIGVMLSSVVDLIWFPTEGHRVHAW